MVGIQTGDEVVGEVEVGGIVVSLLNYLCSPFFLCGNFGFEYFWPFPFLFLFSVR